MSVRTIMVLNPKGGCGKSTIATTLAAYYAERGNKVALADFDSQSSSLDWLAQRPASLPEITGFAAFEPATRIPRTFDFLIMDAPAATHGKDLTQLIRAAQTILIPVMPSPVDIRATSAYLDDIMVRNQVVNEKTKLAVVANRVRENTKIYRALTQYLKGLKIPFIGTLRDSQNYIRAMESGQSIHEFAPAATEIDRKQWAKIFRWLNSAKALPAEG